MMLQTHHLKWQCKPKAGKETILTGKEGSHYAIMLIWNFIVNRTGYSKRFYKIHLFPIFLMFDLFFIYYWDSPGQKRKLKCPKVYEILDYIATVIAALTLSCHTNTITQNLTTMHSLQLKIRNICIRFFWNQKILFLDVKETSNFKQVIGYIIVNKIACCDSSFLLDSLSKANIFFQ